MEGDNPTPAGEKTELQRASSLQAQAKVFRPASEVLGVSIADWELNDFEILVEKDIPKFTLIRVRDIITNHDVMVADHSISKAFAIAYKVLMDERDERQK